MGISFVGNNSALRCPQQQSQLQQIGLIDILDGNGFFADGGGYGFNADRTAVVKADYRLEHPSVGVVESEEVTVTVEGAQTEIGTGYTATATGLAGANAANYTLSGTLTTTFEITAGDTPEPPTPVDPVVCPVIDLTGDTVRDSVVAEGTATVYQGHPTTVTTEDGRIIVVWCTPHGGHCGPAAESSDGGRTWTRIDDRFPAGYSRHVNCPSIYRLVGPDGKSRLWVWSEAKMRDTDGATDYQSCRFDATRSMPSVMSEDDGLTWQEVAPLGEKFLCTMAFTSIVRLKDGSYLGVFHTGASCGMENPRRVWRPLTMPSIENETFPLYGTS